MSLPPTFHRAWLRQRVNALPHRAADRTPQQDAMGTVRPACALGSSWTRFAFSVNDNGKLIEVRGRQLFVDNVLRTELSGPFPVPASKQPLYRREEHPNPGPLLPHL